MVASINIYQQYQQANQLQHKYWKGKTLCQINQITIMIESEVICMALNKVETSRWHIKRDGNTERERWFKQADLNEVSRPQAHSVEIQEVNEYKCKYSSNNGEYQNEEVYIQAYHININEGGKKQVHATWFLDTSATYHLTYLESIKNCQPPLRVVFGDNEQKSHENANICLIMTTDHHIEMTYVYYVPRVTTKHLMLVGQATNNRMTIEFTKNRAMIHLIKTRVKQ